MAESYEIVEHETECGNPILVLRPEGGTDFLEKMKSKPKELQRYRLITRMVARIQFDGPKKYIGRMVRVLDSELSLFELKVAGQVIRVMAYIYQPYAGHRIVLLFDFNGHQGSNKIPGHLMKKGRDLAEIARKNLEEDMRDGNR